MTKFTQLLVTGTAAFSLAMPSAALAQDIEFGDDRSEWAKDGECDDKRFSGEGMTDTPLLDSDVLHDATDCRTAFEKGTITLKTTRTSNIIWGDDNGEWANDGECDDMRFEGPGMTTTPLLDEDVKHDATDCRVAYEQGRLELRK